jgi:triosephosphate isomerase
MTVASRTPIIAGNWKMNMNPEEARALARSIREQLPDLPNIEVLLCPPFVSLPVVADEVKGTRILLGAQNMYPDPSGAFTGEISPMMLSAICQYVILGHSERRNLLKETNTFVNRKVLSALDHGLRPIVCVGETLEQRDAGRTEQVLRRQTRGSLANVPSFSDIAVAYEPVWAIGTGRAATPQDATAGIDVIRETISSMAGKDTADHVPILYGGSVSPSNADELFTQPQLDGGLIGGASLMADQFVGIAIAAQESLR